MAPERIVLYLITPQGRHRLDAFADENEARAVAYMWQEVVAVVHPEWGASRVVLSVRGGRN